MSFDLVIVVVMLIVRVFVFVFLLLIEPRLFYLVIVVIVIFSGTDLSCYRVVVNRILFDSVIFIVIDVACVV